MTVPKPSFLATFLVPTVHSTRRSVLRRSSFYKPATTSCTRSLSSFLDVNDPNRREHSEKAGDIDSLGAHLRANLQARDLASLLSAPERAGGGRRGGKRGSRRGETSGASAEGMAEVGMGGRKGVTEGARVAPGVG